MFMKDELVNIINNSKNNKHSYNVSQNKQLLAWLKEETNFLNEECSLLERIYCALNNVTPTCPRGNTKSFLKSSNLKKGYSFCGTPTHCACAKENHSKKISEAKRTMSNSDIANANEKRKQSCLSKYGTEYISQSQYIKDKKEETCLLKYGVRTNLIAPTTIDKIKQTCLSRYGFENPNQNKVIMTKRANTNLKKYGNICSAQAHQIRDEIQISHLEKYGVKLFPYNIYNDKQLELLTSKQTFEDELNTHGILALSAIYKINPAVLRFRVKTWSLDFKEYRSSGEEMIGKILDKTNIVYEQNTRKIIAPLELDFYLPDHNIAIEVCGLYWHSELRGKDRKYHISKLHSCDQMGIRLITIFEDELSNPGIIESRLSHILGMHGDKIYARKCSVREISLSDTRDFCNAHHIQGYVNSKIKAGLFYDAELVAIMTFGTLRKSMGAATVDNHYELLRYCCIPGKSIIGGASKMFSYFKREFNPESVISYCDRRWGTGKLYSNMGFEFVHNSAPGYWYMDDHRTRKHRYSYRKSEIATSDNMHLTEWQIMQGMGYDRIWDCGTSKWQWLRNR